MGRTPSDKSEWDQAVYVSSDLAHGYSKLFYRDNFIERISFASLWTTYIHFFMSKSSCFRRPFNDIIRKLNKHGLVRKWMMDYTASGSKIHDRDQQILELKHIQGIFFMCSGLYFVAFVVFLFELWMDRLRIFMQWQRHIYRRRRR